MKNANLLRYPHSSSLRRTSMYASFLGISGALHLDVFDQPSAWVFFGERVIGFCTHGFFVARAWNERKETNGPIELRILFWH
jgi:hypothetical protein